MSLLGIDIGTSVVKIALFSEAGRQLAATQVEHAGRNPAPGWAELDAAQVWAHVKNGIRHLTISAGSPPVKALSVSSLGEAVVPVSAGRQILAPAILNYDQRGAEFLPDMAALFPADFLFSINGNTLGNHYSLTKIKWIQKYQPELYADTHSFLHLSAFISFMLGAEPAVDFSLANRTLLFDLAAEDWSEELLVRAGIDREKLPRAVPSGCCIGTVPPTLAQELGLPANVKIISGAHDQCANAVGCGVIEAGSAAYGMGTYLCVTPVYQQRVAADLMIARGLNTEHHAVRGRYVSFLYNQGGALVKWFRDTFAAADYAHAQAKNDSIYPQLFAEMPHDLSPVLVLPHFAPTGPPHFISHSSGLITGLRLEATRGDILKGILEGAVFYLKDLIDSLPQTGISINEFRAAGGGSQSDAWVQLSADIFDQPMVCPEISEAGTLGAAIIAGVGSGRFANFHEASQSMVRLARSFEPRPAIARQYKDRFEQYRRMAELSRGLLPPTASGSSTT